MKFLCWIWLAGALLASSPARGEHGEGIILGMQGGAFFEPARFGLLYQDGNDGWRGKMKTWGRLINGTNSNLVGNDTIVYDFGGNSSIYQMISCGEWWCFLVVQDASVNPYPDVRCFGDGSIGVPGWGNTSEVYDFPGANTPITAMPTGLFSRLSSFPRRTLVLTNLINFFLRHARHQAGGNHYGRLRPPEYVAAGLLGRLLAGSVRERQHGHNRRRAGRDGRQSGALVHHRRPGRAGRLCGAVLVCNFRTPDGRDSYCLRREFGSGPGDWRLY